MKKILTLSNEQALTLYNLLSSYETADRSDNRRRFKFLEVIEEFVFSYEDKLKSFEGKKQADIKVEMKAISVETQEFTFADREAFVKVKDMFEKCFKTGAKNRNQAGKVESRPLTGRPAKIYVQIEDAFADVKELKD